MKILVQHDKSYMLLIVGRGNEKKNLENLSKILGIKNQVVFSGKVSDQKLPNYYATADIFVLPSLIELQGMVVLEAMAVGLPILVADAELSTSKELVKNNGIIFKERNYKELANGIRKIFDDPTLMKLYSLNSLKIAKNHSIDKSVKKLEKIYKYYLNKKSHHINFIREHLSLFY